MTLGLRFSTFIAKSDEWDMHKQHLLYGKPIAKSKHTEPQCMCSLPYMDVNFYYVPSLESVRDAWITSLQRFCAKTVCATQLNSKTVIYFVRFVFHLSSKHIKILLRLLYSALKLFLVFIIFVWFLVASTPLLLVFHFVLILLPFKILICHILLHL